ncbi:hypothetical protein KCP91_08080 [Microvirga sp. SRT01]|uniref:Uncharacterized protein n=1 Tax=Sphingomonas longa TaxID=2778730 RepID=A0ABS2D620_9SPHN|nr:MULTISPECIES: hypothetical protein [Alphaproteobacteria]MBM6576328.1 hypothetical protein [Sphingomonas sp. BT552]MBR7709374.1 hypothetical protein [Microvirga sp. SRT01]
MTIDQSKMLPVYGGPEGMEAMGFSPLALSGYGTFVVAGTPNAGFAYVPEDDTDLLTAYRYSNQVPGDAEADALLGEIERRCLHI